MKIKLSKVFICCLALVFLGCGGGKFKTGEPWDPNEEPFFDDGIDLVEDLSTLSGKWAYDHENAFDGRVQLADLIAIVDVQSVQTSSVEGGEAAKRIDVEVVKSLRGDPPSKQIQLFSSTEAMGHQLILRHEERLSGQFIVFVRWFKDDDKIVRHHFHLSPASQLLIDEIKQRIDAREDEEAKQKS